MKKGQAALDAITDVVLAYKRPKSQKQQRAKSPTAAFAFYEFFSGGGLARAGLGPRWHCLFANDFDLKKSATYIENYLFNVHLR